MFKNNVYAVKYLVKFKYFFNCEKLLTAINGVDDSAFLVQKHLLQEKLSLSVK